MGLTNSSTGHSRTMYATAMNSENCDVMIALAGNPNVGKSTVFNALTGMHQHTGNWPGKTVGSAKGTYQYKDKRYMLVDIPGVYSLMAHSAEEEIARDFICFGASDATVIVCDATCLVRNMNLVLQTIEITDKVILCINLMDEAKRHQITINCDSLAKTLGVPVVPASAGKGAGLRELKKTISDVISKNIVPQPLFPTYRPEIESAILKLLPHISPHTKGRVNPRWVALRMLEGGDFLDRIIKEIPDLSPDLNPELRLALQEANRLLDSAMNKTTLHDALVSDIYKTAESICKNAVTLGQNGCRQKQLTIDRFLTGKFTGIPCMLLLLLGVLWITTTGANYPSALLSDLLFSLETPLFSLLQNINTPFWLQEALVLGVYRVLAWVVSVMLPPMAIFFPLFTLLEDLGYLPRVAFNLDHAFKKCHACGKQALTMCMGFGCNAAGVIGCRIIDSPRERLIAILTNSFVPCNGRFPTMISIITMFFTVSADGILSAGFSSLLLTVMIVLGILLTLLFSFVLSKTILKGFPSSFTLELPPYRKPQIGKVLLRSVFDRTLFVLGRAISVAAPAGLIIYIMANVTVANASLLSHCASALDPFGRLLGMDGVLIMAFILGLPANEIVMPIAIMAYMSSGTLTEFQNLESLKLLLTENGWTWLTATCTMLFSLLHWPCSTTLISIKKETGSLKWACIAFLLPTATGMILCMLFTCLARSFCLA